jgi:hypothetical protein
MGEREERREHRRLDTKLRLQCTPTRSDQGSACPAVTRNVGSGGVYFETNCDEFVPGSLWQFELTVPPGAGHFPYAGQVRGLGEIVRVDGLPDGDNAASAGRGRCGVAARFRQPLKLVFKDR